MKKDFQKKLGLATMAGMLCLSAFTKAAYSMDGVHSNISGTEESQGTERLGNIQNGKALLTFEDLKTLLGLNARDPSDQTTTLRLDQEDPNASSNRFQIGLQRAERKSLSAQLASIQKDRLALETKLNNDADAKRKKVREARKSIQVSRLGAASNSDAKLGRSLYENFIMESNIDAETQKSLSDFDRKHAVSLNFVQIGDEKIVNAIYLGDNQVWSTGSTHNVAAK